MYRKFFDVALILALVVLGLFLIYASIKSLTVKVLTGSVYDVVDKAMALLPLLALAFLSLKTGRVLFEKHNKWTSKEKNQFLISKWLPVFYMILILTVCGLLFFFCPIFIALPTVFLVCNLFLFKERMAKSDEELALNTSLLITLNGIGLILLIAFLVL